MTDHKCQYCGRVSDRLIPLGKHFEIKDHNGRVGWRWIFAPDEGCQSEYQVTNHDMFLQALITELPPLVFSAVLMTVVHLVFTNLDFVYLDPNSADVITALDTIQWYMFAVFIPIPLLTGMLLYGSWAGVIMSIALYFYGTFLV